MSSTCTSAENKISASEENEFFTKFPCNMPFEIINILKMRQGWAWILV
jgi:hypothetical protein